MTRSEILQSASQIVTQDREQQYGSPEDNFKTIAEFWNTYENARCEAFGVNMGEYTTRDLDAHDVAIMMCLLKIARIAAGKPKADNYIDLAGYTACAGEIAVKVEEVADNTAAQEAENKAVESPACIALDGCIECKYWELSFFSDPCNKCKKFNLFEPKTEPVISKCRQCKHSNCNSHTPPCKGCKGEGFEQDKPIKNIVKLEAMR